MTDTTGPGAEQTGEPGGPRPGGAAEQAAPETAEAEATAGVEPSVVEPGETARQPTGDAEPPTAAPGPIEAEPAAEPAAEQVPDRREEASGPPATETGEAAEGSEPTAEVVAEVVVIEEIEAAGPVSAPAPPPAPLGEAAPAPADAPTAPPVPTPETAPPEAAAKAPGDDRDRELRGSPRRRAVPTRHAPAGAMPEATPAWSRNPRSPLTLAVDVGGTGIKASVLDAEGRMVADRVRVTTTYPLTPDDLVDAIVQLARPMPSFDRVSVGFPGVVRQGRVLTAPHFVTVKGPGSKVSPELVRAWKGFRAADVLGARLGRAVRIANDADMQGMAVIGGSGLELVVTLGTGVGTAVFLDGRLESHIELAHHPFRKGQTYNEQLGDATLQRIGPAKWRRRVARALANFEILFNYDHCYLGGGNARRASGHVDPSIVIVDNVAGILGGVKLWEHSDHHI